MRITALSVLMSIGASAAFAAPPAGFDARVESLRKDIGVPGMAIAIVENDKVALAKGFGVKRLGSPDPVDADTIFMTGSTGKAFTGKIEVAQSKGGLTIDFGSTPRMGGALQHWQYDSFVTRFDDKTIEPAYVTFGLNADGKVERITMKAVSPLADFSYDYQDLLFTPVAQKTN
jgi:Domain of unknown function (DUF3471)/Beta-lactamase